MASLLSPRVSTLGSSSRYDVKVASVSRLVTQTPPRVGVCDTTVLVKTCAMVLRHVAARAAAAAAARLLARRSAPGRRRINPGPPGSRAHVRCAASGVGGTPQQVRPAQSSRTRSSCTAPHTRSRPARQGLPRRRRPDSPGSAERPPPLFSSLTAQRRHCLRFGVEPRQVRRAPSGTPLKFRWPLRPASGDRAPSSRSGSQLRLGRRCAARVSSSSFKLSFVASTRH